MEIKLKFPTSDAMHNFVDQARVWSGPDRWTWCQTVISTATVEITAATIHPETLALAKSFGGQEVK